MVTALAQSLHRLLPHRGKRSVAGTAHEAVLSAARERMVMVYREHRPRKLKDVEAPLQEW